MFAVLGAHLSEAELVSAEHVAALIKLISVCQAFIANLNCQ